MQLVSTNSLTVSKVSDFDPIRFPLFSKTNYALLMTEIVALKKHYFSKLDELKLLLIVIPTIPALSR